MRPREIRHALRGLFRRPGFTLVAVSTLALGIGANTAIFSAVWHLLLAPLPFPDGDRMGYLWDATESGFQVVPSSEQADAFITASRTLDWIEPYSSSIVAWQGDQTTEAIEAGLITSSLPERLGVRPVIGRGFTEVETSPGGPPVALLSESFWKTALGGTRDVIGSTLRLDGRSWEVVGVMPDRLSRFRQGSEPRDVWLPLDRTGEDRTNLLVVHRAGVTPEQVGEELTAISANIPEARLGAEQPVTHMRKPGDMLGSTTKTALMVLLAAVGLVLLIACANVAGLLLIRGSDRRRELAIRAALGADRFAILRYLLTETTLIAVAGGAAGLLLGAWGIELIRSVRPAYLSELDGIGMDPTVLAFAAGLTILTLAVFGLLPSIFAARSDLRTQFTQTSGGSTGSPHGGRAGGLLVAVEVALAVVLLIGAALLVRTMVELRREPLGFDGTGALRIALELPRAAYPDQASLETFGNELTQQIEALPGVASVSPATGVPPQLGILFGQLQAEGQDAVAGDRLMQGAEVGEAFFRTLRIDLLEGRAFDGTEADAETIIMNRSTADRLWPGESPIGKRVRIGSSEQAPWLTVIGITPDLAVSGPRSPRDRPQIFTPIGYSFPFITMAIRVRSGDPLAVMPAVRSVVARLDPTLPVRDAATVEQLLAESVGRDRFNMLLFASFAGLALVLATVGLYGIIAFNVSRRTRELGIRTALGATPHGVSRMVLRQGTMLTLAGTVAGCLVSLRLVGLMEAMLHGVTPHDPLSFGAATAMVFAVSLLATWVPARRASRVDPMVALRDS